MPRRARMYIPNLPYQLIIPPSPFYPFWSEQVEMLKMSTVKAQKTWHMCEFMANFTNKICVQSRIIKTGEQRCEKANYPPMVPHDCRIVRPR